MTRLTVEISVPWTAEELRKAVADLDEADSGKGQGIAAAEVSAADVMQYLFNAEIGVVYQIERNEFRA